MSDLERCPVSEVSEVRLYDLIYLLEKQKEEERAKAQTDDYIEGK